MDTPEENPGNVLVTPKDISRLLRSYGCYNRVKDITVYYEAFTHKSLVGGRVEDYEAARSNERLEFIGDAVVGVAVAQYLFDRFPNENEGFLTRLKTRIVCHSSLAAVARSLGLPRFLLISRYIEEQCEGRNNTRFYEDTFEALVGAISLDMGIEPARKFVVGVLEKCPAIDVSVLVREDHNYKDQLLRYFQSHFNGAFPTYVHNGRLQQRETGLRSGAKGSRAFSACVLDPYGKVLGVGSGSNKKEAEQRASYEALRALGADGVGAERENVSAKTK